MPHKNVTLNAQRHYVKNSFSTSVFSKKLFSLSNSGSVSGPHEQEIELHEVRELLQSLIGLYFELSNWNATFHFSYRVSRIALECETVRSYITHAQPPILFIWFPMPQLLLQQFTLFQIQLSSLQMRILTPPYAIIINYRWKKRLFSKVARSLRKIHQFVETLSAEMLTLTQRKWFSITSSTFIH